MLDYSQAVTVSALSLSMDRPHIHVNIHTLDDYTLFYENIDAYVSEKNACFSSYRDELDFVNEMKVVSDHLTRWPASAILERMSPDDPEALLDIAIRYVSLFIVRTVAQ